EACAIAVAEGFGLALGNGPAADEALELRLVKDDVPIEGRILDLQGRPIAGVEVGVRAVKATTGNDLTPWLDALRTRRSAYDVESDFFTHTWYPPDDIRLGPSTIPRKDGDGLTVVKFDRAIIFGSPIAPVVTGADGRFKIAGIGRERLATLSI